MVRDSHIHAQRLAKTNPRRLALLLFLIALAVRLVFLFLSPNNGNDAWLRYQDALFWSHHPTQLPPDANMWLPLHFWLLGAVLRIWASQEATRLFTALLGALTVVPFWGAMRRAFSAPVALASSLALALFGFHIGYSVTTSSEAPTIFFMAIALYGWVRLREDGRAGWGVAGGLALSAAALCRFEPWVAIPILAVLLLDFSRGWSSLVSNHAAWLRAVCFAAPAAAGSVAWMIFSWVKWNDPFAVPHRNMLLTATVPAVLRHSLPFRLAVVPGSLLVSLDPVILILAGLGLILVLPNGARVMDHFQARQRSSAGIPSLRSGRALPASLPDTRQVELRPGPPGRPRYFPEPGSSGRSLARPIAILALALAGTDYFNAVINHVTQARFTLMYSWLLFPFAFEGLEWISHRYERKGGVSTPPLARDPYFSRYPRAERFGRDEPFSAGIKIPGERPSSAGLKPRPSTASSNPGEKARLRWLAARFSAWNRRTLYAGVAVFFLLWQAGIIAGAAYAPANIADRLGVMSPMLPLRRELRNVTGWLKQHTAPFDAVIIDSFDYDAGDIVRFADLRPSQVFQVRNSLVNRALLRTQIGHFVTSRHPRFLVCAPQGPLCSMWGVDGHAQMDVGSAGIRLVREWKGRRWRVYGISYSDTITEDRSGRACHDDGRKG